VVAPRRCARVPGALWRRTLDGALVWLPGASTPLDLTPIAAVIWAELAEPRDVEALIASLAPRFGTDHARVAAEVHALLDDLQARGAVRCPA
jgi:hypothetical protein